MAKRQTREERQAEYERNHRATKVAEFRKMQARLQGLRAYNERAAFSEDQDRVAMALWEMVRQHDNAVGSLRKEAARMVERMADVERRLEAGDRPNWSSSVVGSSGNEIDALAVQVNTLAECVLRLAWATGWYVPQVMSKRDVARHARICSVGVAHQDVGSFGLDCTHHEPSWRVTLDGATMTAADAGLQEHGDAPIVYASEEAAWVAAMAYCGDRF